MKITCPHCAKGYKIDEAKLPSGFKSAKCKACGHLITLVKAPAKAPVIVSPKPAVKPVAPDIDADDFIRFRCAGCSKKYKIKRQKIPPRVVAVICRACGQKIHLPSKVAIKTADDGLRDTGAQDRTPPIGLELSPDKSPPVSRAGHKKQLLAAAVFILLLLAIGVLVNLNYIKLDWLTQYFPGAAEKSTDTVNVLDIEPFLVLNLNFPSIIEAIKNRQGPDKPTARLQWLKTTLISMDLRQLSIYAFLTPDKDVLPVILAQDINPQQLKNAINRHEAFKNYFTRTSKGTYRLNEDAIDQDKKYNLPREPYQLILFDRFAALAPVSFSGVIKDNSKVFSNTPIAKFARTIETQQDLAKMAIRLPEGFTDGWQHKIQNHPAVQSTPQTAMIAGMGSALISKLEASLKLVDILALGIRLNGQNQRTLSYAQLFRVGVDGEKIFRRLSAENPDDTEINDLIRNLVALFQDQRFRHTVDFHNNRLALEFSWSQSEDDVFFKALTVATLGQLFDDSVAMSPTAGEVETRYATEPNIVANVDAEQLKATIPQMIKDSLFPGQYWNMGNQPRLTLDLDTIDFPNAALAELTYDVKSVQSPDGKDVSRVEENAYKQRIQPGSLIPGNISINVKKDTPPGDLAKAIIEFNLTVPVALEVFDFVTKDRIGTTKDAAGIRVTLDRFEKDVARVTSGGGQSVRLIAYDKTGKALASRETMRTSSSIVSRFEGIIKTLSVLVTRDELEYAFEIEVDLNRGKELVLSREPEVPPRLRFNPHPVLTYANFQAEDLKELTVAWTEGNETSWFDSLSLRLPQGPFSGHAVWEAHFFGRNKPQLLAGNSLQGPKDVSLTFDKGELKHINAAFGNVQLNVHSDISRLVFLKKGDRQPISQTLPSGGRVFVAFNKNEITYSADNNAIIQTIAYDTWGKRLKQDQYSRSRGGKRNIYFWGVPVKFEIDVATKTLKQLIPFDIRQRPVDEAAYLAFKQSIDNQRDVVKAIKVIDRTRRQDRSYYGDDLAGLFYLYQGQHKKPQRLISQEIAHSDPAGQARFGYEARPYKGYYFTVLLGVETNSVKKKYSRRSKKSRFAWQNGTIITTPLTRHPDLVAIPADMSHPTFFIQWGQVYMKALNGVRLEYLPTGYYNKGWVEAKFIDQSDP